MVNKLKNFVPASIKARIKARKYLKKLRKRMFDLEKEDGKETVYENYTELSYIKEETGGI